MIHTKIRKGEEKEEEDDNKTTVPESSTIPPPPSKTFNLNNYDIFDVTGFV